MVLKYRDWGETFLAFRVSHRYSHYIHRNSPSRILIKNSLEEDRANKYFLRVFIEKCLKKEQEIF